MILIKSKNEIDEKLNIILKNILEEINYIYVDFKFVPCTGIKLMSNQNKILFFKEIHMQDFALISFFFFSRLGASLFIYFLMLSDYR